MPPLICPECDAKIRLKSPVPAGKKIRCPECKHAFAPHPVGDDDDDDDTPRKKKPVVDDDDVPRKKKPIDDDDEDESPRSSKKRQGEKSSKKGKKKSSALPLILLGASGVLLLLVLVGAGILYAIFGRTGGGPGPGDGGPVGGGPGPIGGGIFGRSPTINKATYDKLEHGMIQKEIDDILGAPGTNASRQDAIKFVLQYEQFDGPPEDPLFFQPTASYVLYTSGPQQLLVGFVKTKYGDVCADYSWWDPVAKKVLGNHNHSAVNVIEATREALLKTRADREASPKYFADPKWKKGPEIRSSILGFWKGTGADYEFNKDGTLVYYHHSTKDKKTYNMKGSYKFTDDDHIQLQHVTIEWLLKAPASNCKVYVSATELNLAEKTPAGDYIKGRTFTRQKK